jgi:hypothetical protein
MLGYLQASLRRWVTFVYFSYKKKEACKEDKLRYFPAHKTLSDYFLQILEKIKNND